MATARANQPTRQPATRDARPPRRRVLRIGILLNRTLVEERQMSEITDVTIGQSAKNTFSIPLDNMPRQFTMFAADGEHWRLNFTPAMDGRISEGGQPLRLTDLKSRSENKGDYFSWKLPETTRGKIEMGDFTLLFQFVAEPPKAPKPMLPASVRGTFADRIEPRIATIVAISVLAHFSLAMYAKYFYDGAKDKTLVEEAYAITFQPEETTIALVETVPVVPTDTGSAGSAAAEAKGDEKKPEPDKKGGGGDKSDKTPDSSDNSGDGRDSNDAVALADEAIRYADMLASEDLTGGGVLGDMDRRKPGTDLGKQVADVAASGASVKVGGGSSGGSRGNGDPRVGTGKGTGVGTGGVDSSGTAKADAEPAGRISVSSKSGGDDSTLTPDAVLKRIMDVYMAGLKRCYKDHLKVDPAARGKVALSFTVNEKGRAVSNNASGFASEVDGCVEQRMGSWTFGIPKDGDGEPTDAQFKIQLQFVPD